VTYIWLWLTRQSCDGGGGSPLRGKATFSLYATRDLRPADLSSFTSGEAFDWSLTITPLHLLIWCSILTTSLLMLYLGLWKWWEVSRYVVGAVMTSHYLSPRGATVTCNPVYCWGGEVTSFVVPLPFQWHSGKPPLPLIVHYLIQWLGWSLDIFLLHGFPTLPWLYFDILTSSTWYRQRHGVHTWHFPLHLSLQACDMIPHLLSLCICQPGLEPVLWATPGSQSQVECNRCRHWKVVHLGEPFVGGSLPHLHSLITSHCRWGHFTLRWFIPILIWEHSGMESLVWNFVHSYNSSVFWSHCMNIGRWNSFSLDMEQILITY